MRFTSQELIRNSKMLHSQDEYSGVTTPADETLVDSSTLYNRKNSEP